MDVKDIGSKVDKTLVQAAEEGDVQSLMTLLASGAPVHQRNAKGSTPLHLAAGAGHVQVLMKLLEAGATIDVLGPGFRTPLHLAAAGGHVEATHYLVSGGAQVNFKDTEGCTPFMLAVRGGLLEAASFLFTSGSSPSETDRIGDTPLIVAIKKQQWCVVEWMIDNSITLDILDKDGNSAMVHASRVGAWHIVSKMCDKRASVNYSDDSNCPLYLMSENGEAEFLIKLLNCYKWGKVQLKQALAKAKNPGILWALEDASPGMLQSNEGEWALLEAARNGRSETLTALLDAGVYINSVNYLGQTALMVAVILKNYQLFSILRNRGANTNIIDRHGRSAMSYFNEKDSSSFERDIVKRLLNTF